MYWKLRSWGWARRWTVDGRRWTADGGRQTVDGLSVGHPLRAPWPVNRATPMYVGRV
jgi:hypothetical protein